MCEPKKREVEVSIQFDLTQMSAAERELVWSAAKALKAAGIGFDTGTSGKVLDWEWDWSLSGPVKVFFDQFVDENPRNRYHHENRMKLDRGAQVEGVDQVKDMMSEIECEREGD